MSTPQWEYDLRRDEPAGVCAEGQVGPQAFTGL
jgi:hypothetical protein